MESYDEDTIGIGDVVTYEVNLGPGKVVTARHGKVIAVMDDCYVLSPAHIAFDAKTNKFVSHITGPFNNIIESKLKKYRVRKLAIEELI